MNNPQSNIDKFMRITDGVVSNNVVFSMGLGMAFIIAVSVELKKSIIISILIAINILVCCTISYFIGDKIHKRLKTPLIVMISISITMLSSFILFSKQSAEIAELGIYIPLVAVNSIMLEIINMDIKQTKRSFFSIIISYILGFTLVICGVSAVREILADRALYEIPIEWIKIKNVAVRSPFFGFIMIGVLAAGFRLIGRLTLYIADIGPKYSGKRKEKHI